MCRRLPLSCTAQRAMKVNQKADQSAIPQVTVGEVEVAIKHV